jgi:hypothetical protein
MDNKDIDILEQVNECIKEGNKLLTDEELNIKCKVIYPPSKNISIQDEVELVEMLTSLIIDPTRDPVLDNIENDSCALFVPVSEPEPIQIDSPVTVPECNSANNTFIQIIDNIISSKDIQREKNITCSSDLCFFIPYIIINDPDFLISIELSFENIVKQHKMSINEVPNIISYVIKLYLLLCNVYKESNLGEQCGNILKFVYTILVQERIVSIDNNEDVLPFLYNLIDSCVELVTLPNKTKPIKKTFSFFNFGLGCSN